MKRLIMILCLLSAPLFGATIEVATEGDLQAMHDNPSSNFVLTADILMSDTNFASYVILDPDMTFDLDGHTIDGLYASSGSWARSCMFGECDANGKTVVIKNGTMTNFFFKATGGGRIGLIAYFTGTDSSLTFTNMHIHMTTSGAGSYVGTVGQGYRDITFVDSTIAVTHTNTGSGIYVGPLVGNSGATLIGDNLNITMTYVDAGSAASYIGAVCGRYQLGSAALTDSTITGYLNADAASDYVALMGAAVNGTSIPILISNCVFSGNVIVDDWGGGILGLASATGGSTIRDCTLRDFTLETTGLSGGVMNYVYVNDVIQGCTVSNVVFIGGGGGIAGAGAGGHIIGNTVIDCTFTNAGNVGGLVYEWPSTGGASTTEQNRVIGLKVYNVTAAGGIGYLDNLAAAVIRDNYVADISFLGTGDVGGAFYRQNAGVIERNWVTGTAVSGADCGGFIYWQPGGTISNCIADVTGADYEFAHLKSGIQTNNAVVQQGIDAYQSGGTVQWEEDAISDFYDADHGVYDPWDFATPIWYEWDDRLPRFTEQPADATATWRRRYMIR